MKHLISLALIFALPLSVFAQSNSLFLSGDFGVQLSSFNFENSDGDQLDYQSDAGIIAGISIGYRIGNLDIEAILRGFEASSNYENEAIASSIELSYFEPGLKASYTLLDSSNTVAPNFSIGFSLPLLLNGSQMTNGGQNQLVRGQDLNTSANFLLGAGITKKLTDNSRIGIDYNLFLPLSDMENQTDQVFRLNRHQILFSIETDL